MISSRTQPRKRQRLTLVCDNCKKRKIRCDKGSPCTACLRSSIGPSCSYYLAYTSPTSPNGEASEISSSEKLYITSARKPISLGPQVSVLKFKKNDLTQPPPRKSSVHSQATALDPEVSPNTQEQAPVDFNSARKELELLEQKIKQLEAMTTGGAKPKDIPSTEPHSRSSQTDWDSSTRSSFSGAIGNNGSNGGSLSDHATSPTFPFNGNAATSPVRASPSTSFNSRKSTDGPKITLPPLNFNNAPVPGRFIQESQFLGAGKAIYGSIPPSVKSSSTAAGGYINTYCPGSSIYVNSGQSCYVGINPVGDTQETINFYETYMSPKHKKTSKGPLSWSSILEKDPGLSLLYKYMVDTNVKCGMNLPSRAPDLPLNKQSFATMENLLNLLPDKPVTVSSLVEACLLKRNPNVEKLFLVERILLVLPKRNIVWCLLKRYFVCVYVYFPFLDEDTFISKITNIIGPESDDPESVISELKITAKVDFAHIGILLIVLRLSYFSLFRTSDKFNEEFINSCFLEKGMDGPVDIHTLVNTAISKEVIEVANLCLNLFVEDDLSILLVTETKQGNKIFTVQNNDTNGSESSPGLNMNLTVLQLCFFIRIHNRFAPEDEYGNDGEDAQVSTAIIIQMAYTLGLNKDFDVSSELAQQKSDSIKRKVWYFAVFSDLYLSYTFGNPLSIQKLYYGLQMPQFSEFASNLRNLQLDHDITLFYFAHWGDLLAVQDLLKVILDVDKHPRVIEVVEVLNAYEVQFFEKYHCLESCMELAASESTFGLAQLQIDEIRSYGNSSFLDAAAKKHVESSKVVFRVHLYISIVSFLVSIYFHLYHYYLLKNVNISFYYAKKTLTMLTEMVPKYFELIRSGTRVCDYVLLPVLAMTIHKSTEILLSVAIKLNFIIYEMKVISRKQKQTIQFYEYLNSVENFKNSVLKLSHLLVLALSRLSKVNYFAWKLTKCHSRVIEVHSNEEFYRAMYDVSDGYLKLPVFSVYQIKELHRIISSCVERTANETNNEFSGVHYVPDPEVDKVWMQYAYESKADASVETFMVDIFASSL